MTAYSTTELKHFILAASHAAAVVDAVMADGQVGLTDLPRIPALLGAIREFSQVKFKDLVPEAKDLSPEEAAQLATYFKAEFNISNDVVEVAVEQGLDILVQLASALQDVGSIVGQIRGKPAA